MTGHLSLTRNEHVANFQSVFQKYPKPSALYSFLFNSFGTLGLLRRLRDAGSTSGLLIQRSAQTLRRVFFGLSDSFAGSANLFPLSPLLGCMCRGLML
ncbi:hypothetical protein EYF80_052914 [Liparis tanakae]|uniref:Uncharacterized protein n=1 Tax=Liparis tanakae TaxID=230148 RepID=A0A4Z2F6N0_9TELE|nr:hypothetical protein EYF80_052914 [Liparis tanakae]